MSSYKFVRRLRACVKPVDHAPLSSNIYIYIYIHSLDTACVKYHSYFKLM